jgi:hypothetical protein
MDLYQFSASKPQFASLAVVGEPDLVIEGKHCSVACYRIAEQSDGEKWHFSPCCIPVGRTFSSDSDEEWISNAISLQTLLALLKFKIGCHIEIKP